jgi:hypothetical protein
LGLGVAVAQHQEALDTERRLLLGAICEEAEVANTHKAFRKDVEQEATDELIRPKRHWPKSIGVSSIAVRESDAALIQ